LIEVATNRITNNHKHQISQAKLAIATANRKLENLESPVLVFQNFAEYELEPPDVGELREELAALNQRLVTAYQLLEITPSKREKWLAIKQVKEFVEGVILSLSTESIIRWNPLGGVLTG
jgi:hypothetical protein